MSSAKPDRSATCRGSKLSRLLMMAAIASFSAAVCGGEPGRPAEAMEALWRAPDAEAARRALAAWSSDLSFDQLFAELEQGPAFEAIAPGVYEEEVEGEDGERYHFAYVVPDGYRGDAPSRVRFMLHGGVSTRDRRRGGRGPIENLRRAPEITVLPSAWHERPWWSDAQVANLSSILRRLKQILDIDEDQVHLPGSRTEELECSSSPCVSRRLGLPSRRSSLIRRSWPTWSGRNSYTW